MGAAVLGGSVDEECSCLPRTSSVGCLVEWGAGGSPSRAEHAADSWPSAFVRAAKKAAGPSFLCGFWDLGQQWNPGGELFVQVKSLRLQGSLKELSKKVVESRVTPGTTRFGRRGDQAGAHWAGVEGGVYQPAWPSSRPVE